MIIIKKKKNEYTSNRKTQHKMNQSAKLHKSTRHQQLAIGDFMNGNEWDSIPESYAVWMTAVAVDRQLDRQTCAQRITIQCNCIELAYGILNLNSIFGFFWGEFQMSSNVVNSSYD